MTDLYQKNNIIDKIFKISDLDLNIKACTNNSASLQLNSAYSVVRHEFFELQVRVGIDKFFRSGLCKTETEALDSFFHSNMYLNVNYSDWRIKRYYNEECDLILTVNKELLLAVYEGSKGRYSKSIDKKGLTEEDFIMMMQEHGFFNEKFTQRYGYICFHLALMTRIDEISNNTYMIASFIEFLEAFSRIIDLEDSQDPEKEILIGYCNEETPLEKKLESALGIFSYLKVRRSKAR